jgi:hypothetical protein
VVLTMSERATPETAEILALEALAWLAGQPDGIARFLTVTGLEAGDLRQAAGDRDLLGSVLDFMLTNEPLLLEFCQDASIPPKRIHVARHHLAG